MTDSEQKSNLLAVGRRRVVRALWWSAGADPSLVERIPPSEQARYVSLALVVITETLLSTILAGCALAMVLDGLFLNVAIVTFWGIVNFSLDRMLLQSITPKLHWIRRFTRVFPRIVLSVLISVVVARLLTIGIFRQELDRFNRQEREHAMQQIDEQLAAYRVEIPALQAYLRDVENRADVALQQYMQEVDGTGGSGSIGIGAIANLKMQRYAEEKANLDRVRPILVSQIQSKTANSAALSTRRVELSERASSTDLLARSLALRALSRREPAAKFVELAAALTIIIFSIAPFLVKLVQPKSLYDELVELETNVLRGPLIGESPAVKRINEATQSAFSRALEQSELNPKHTGA
jgi:hypothetical protein